MTSDDHEFCKQVTTSCTSMISGSVPEGSESGPSMARGRTLYNYNKGPWPLCCFGCGSAMGRVNVVVVVVVVVVYIPKHSMGLL